MFALLGLIVVGMGILALLSLILPGGAFGILIVLFGFFLFGALHYILWGWWMTKPPAPPAPGEEDAQEPFSTE